MPSSRRSSSLEWRGRVPAVATSADAFAGRDEPTGYELTEPSRPCYVFAANGFEVDVASPQGDGRLPFSTTTRALSTTRF